MTINRDSSPARGFRWESGLLGQDDVDPVGHERAAGASDFIIICDHAGNLMPNSLGNYGLTASDFEQHLAYDIGALAVSRFLSDALDAELLYQRYSRILIDCNRPPHSPEAFVTFMDGVHIARNERLDLQQIASRIAEIFLPYHARMETVIMQRLAAGRPPVVVSVHSFTPDHSDHPGARPWHIGVLFNRDSRFALAVIAALEAEGDLVVGVNQPYGIDDDGDYAIPVHCERLGLLHVELEIRQDLISQPKGQKDWGKRLSRVLPASLAEIDRTDLRNSLEAGRTL